MRHTFIVAALVVGVFVAASPAAAGQSPSYAEKDAVAVLLSLDQEAPMAPIRQNAVVYFYKPVRVGTKVLMGKYIIEHDTDRMARGEPCTHIYNYNNKKLVVGFHCTHLTRSKTETATVSLKPANDSGVAQMREFQFAGDSDAHGVPNVR